MAFDHKTVDPLRFSPKLSGQTVYLSVKITLLIMSTYLVLLFTRSLSCLANASDRRFIFALGQKDKKHTPLFETNVG